MKTVLWIIDISRLKENSCNVAGDGPSNIELNDACFQRYGFKLQKVKFMADITGNYWGFRVSEAQAGAFARLIFSYNFFHKNNNHHSF